MRFLNNMSARALSFAGFLVSVGLIGIGVYLQIYENLEPCPLCMLQRICYMTLGFILLAAAVQGPGKVGMRIYAGLGFVAALTGVGLAVRHVALQWYPPEFNACTADLFFQLRKFPFWSVIERALRATGDCAVVDWTLLHLSIAEWSLVWYVALAVLSIFMFRRAGRRAA